jgi:hypothetical protein
MFRAVTVRKKLTAATDEWQELKEKLTDISKHDRIKKILGNSKKSSIKEIKLKRHNDNI